MAKIENYKCDICDTTLSRSEGAYDKMVGLRFTVGNEFKIDDINSTGNKHVCYACLKILKSEIDSNDLIQKRIEVTIV